VRGTRVIRHTRRVRRVEISVTMNAGIRRARNRQRQVVAAATRMTRYINERLRVSCPRQRGRSSIRYTSLMRRYVAMQEA